MRFLHTKDLHRDYASYYTGDSFCTILLENHDCFIRLEILPLSRTAMSNAQIIVIKKF